MNYYYKYENLTAADERYFIGENTGDGFISERSLILNESRLDRLYIIKGAAGTGKSTFMNAVAKESEKKGYKAVRYLCGSDPSSLDAVVIDGRIAVADGTAPHVLEMEYPGASSEIIDMTNFWDKSKLIAERENIVALSERKRRRFNNAYKSLKAIDLLRRDAEHKISEAINLEKSEEFILRFIRGFGKPDRGGRERKSTYAVSMKGMFKLPVFESMAENIFKVSDCYSSGTVFMNLVCDKLSAAGYGINVSYDHLGGGVREIFLPSQKILITADESDKVTKTLNMKRFVNADKLAQVKGGIKLSLKCRELFENDIKNDLSDAGEAHFGLEKIYGKSMNFESLSEYTELKKNEIISSLES